MGSDGLSTLLKNEPQEALPKDSCPLVLHVITGLGTGGAESMLCKLLGAGADGRRAAVVSLMDEGTAGERVRRLGVPLLALGMQRGVADLCRLVGLRRLKNRLRPSLVQGWMYHGNLAATVAGFGDEKDVPVIWNVRQSLYDLKLENRVTRAVIRLNAALARRPARIIYNSSMSARQHEALGFARDRTHVIPNGFDLSMYRPDLTARAKLRRKLGVGNHTVLVSMVARYHPMKNHAGFLGAIARLERDSDCCAVLIGKGLDEHNYALHELITRLGMTNRVRFLGERADIPQLMAALDIVCSASSWGEGFPNIIGEAMACGVPCVVTNVGDSAHVVGDTGKVVPADDPEALAGALRSLISMGSESRQRLGAAARARIAKNFSIEHVARQYETLYAEVLDGVRNRRTV